MSDNAGSGSSSGVQTVYIATGNNFPDALAGSVYAAQHQAPIILVDVNLPEQVIQYLEAGELSKAVIFGGEYVVRKGVEDQLRDMVGR